MSTVARCYSEHPKLSYLYTQFFWCNRDMKKCHGGVSSLPTDGKSLVDTVLTTGRHCFSHWRTFKRKLASKATLFPEGLKVSVDKNLGFQLEELGRGGFLPRALYYYRYYPGNMSRCHGRDQKRTTTCLAFQYRDRRKKEGIIPYPIRKMK